MNLSPIPERNGGIEPRPTVSGLNQSVHVWATDPRLDGDGGDGPLGFPSLLFYSLPGAGLALPDVRSSSEHLRSHYTGL